MTLSSLSMELQAVESSSAGTPESSRTVFSRTRWLI